MSQNLRVPKRVADPIFPTDLFQSLDKLRQQGWMCLGTAIGETPTEYSIDEWTDWGGLQNCHVWHVDVGPDGIAWTWCKS